MTGSRPVPGGLQGSARPAPARRSPGVRQSTSLLPRLPFAWQGTIVFRTAFGHVPLASPRFYRCRCHPADSQTFSPLAELFTEHTAPELLYLESRWASLISFGMTLLKDVLPVADTTNPETVRQHLHRVAVRQDAELGTAQPGGMDKAPAACRPSPVPRENVIVGIDGG